MRNLILLTVFISVSTILSAYNWIPTNSSGKLTSDVTLVKSADDEIIYNVAVNAYGFTNVNVNGLIQKIVLSPEASRILEKSAPDLPKISTSFIVPDKMQMKAEIVSSQYIDIQDVNIAPSKGNLLRNINPSDVPFEYGEAYQKDEFYPGTLAKANDPYIMRDYRGQAVWVYPFQYNPATKVLRIYTNLTIKLIPSGNTGKNPFSRTKAFTSVSKDYNLIYKKHFLNFNSSKYTPIEEEGNILVICHTNYLSTMQPYVDWKKFKGVPTEMVEYSSIATNATTLKTYITNYYNTKGVTYILLVGDAPNIPAMDMSGDDSDEAYGFIVGSDSYAEAFVGRFSGETADQIQTQVERTVNYEKYPVEGSDWYGKFALVGSDQGPGDDSEYDYQHMQNIKPDLLGYTYSTGNEFYDGSQGGLDASGDPVPADMITEFNKGRGVAAYCGHGDVQMWVTSGFNNTNVASLANDNMLPFIFSVACVNGDFVSNTCFAEAWLRATHNGNPTGAIAFLGSTINQSWAPPMAAQDEMIDVLTESYVDNIKRTFAGIAVSGCMLMNDEYQDYQMTNTWSVFGDPALNVRTAAPVSMVVTHPATVFVGAAQATITCDTEGALVALTINGEIIGTGYVSGGFATIGFDQLSNVGFIDVCVTAYNKVPYIGQIQIVPAQGAYVVYKNSAKIDGNNNIPETGETINLDVTLENVGLVPATGVTAEISTTDSYIDITDSVEGFGTIADGDTSFMASAYVLNVANNIPDQRNVTFTMNITDDLDSSWTSYFSIKFNAPVFVLCLYQIDDAAGNGNGRLDPGETVNLIFKVANTGHALASDINCILSSLSIDVTLNTNSTIINAINYGNDDLATFNVTISPSAIIGSVADFTFDITSGGYSKSMSCFLNIGLTVEDWESNSFTTYPWTSGGDAPWVITSGSVYEGSFAAQSGDISPSSWGQPDNTSELYLSMNVLNNDTIAFYRKVSSEQGYDFLRFYIDATVLGEWSGEQDWAYVKYPISAGQRNLKWIYSEDYYLSSGQDCGWIDFVVLPAHDFATTIYKINDLDNASLNVYPNPSNGEFNMEFSLTEKSIVSASVTDITGKTLYQILETNEMQTGNYRMKMAHELPSGNYLLDITINDKRIIRKLVVCK